MNILRCNTCAFCKAKPHNEKFFYCSLYGNTRYDMDNHNVDTLSCACEFYRERTADNQHYTRISGWTHDIPALIAANTDIEKLLRETIAVLSADIYTIIYNPDKGMGWKETSAQIVSWAERFESELNWKDDDERDFITELEKFERKVLEEYGEC